MQKAAFLDRDGVLNVDCGYVHRWEDFKFIPGAIEGMRRLQDIGYLLVIVTNQSGISRGKYTTQEYAGLMRTVWDFLYKRGVFLSGMYHCPHHPHGVVAEYSIVCGCRKPAPGLILKAARDLNLDLCQSILVGDNITDIEAANAAGVGKAYLITRDTKSVCDFGKSIQADGAYPSLLACVSSIILGADRSVS